MTASVRLTAYHEAGHVVAFVAGGLGMPRGISLERRDDSAARTILGCVFPTEHNRDALAVYWLAGYVAECRLRGWRNVDPVRYCHEKRWSGATEPGGDLYEVAHLYGFADWWLLPDDVLRTLWAKTAALFADPFVWSATEALAAITLQQHGVDRDGLYAWLERFPALERWALQPPPSR